MTTNSANHSSRSLAEPRNRIRLSGALLLGAASGLILLAPTLARAQSQPILAWALPVPTASRENDKDAGQQSGVSRFLVPFAPGVEPRDVPGYWLAGLHDDDEDGHDAQIADISKVVAGPLVTKGRSVNYRVLPVVSNTQNDWQDRTYLSQSARIGVGGAPLFANTGDWFATGPAALDSNGSNGMVSGRVTAIATDPTDASTYYVAAAGGGLWKTTNGGTSYSALTDGQPNTAMGAVAVAPSNHQIVWAGTGEANNSADSRAGSGLLKSTDGGANWLVIPGPSNGFVRYSVSKIVIDPTNANTVYVGFNFGVNGFSGNVGVWKTTDGGTTWALVLTGFISDISINPSTPQTVYAAGGYAFGTSSNGVYKTTNGGTNWALVGSSLPSGSGTGRFAIALAPSAPNTLYVSIARNGTGGYGLLGMYKTTDGGTTWAQLANAPNYLRSQGWYNHTLAVNPANANIVFGAGVIAYNGIYGSEQGVVASTDGGTTWYDMTYGQNHSGPHTDHHALAFTAGATPKLLNGNDGGVWMLNNPSQASYIQTSATDISWTNVNGNLNTIQFTGVAVHPTQTVAYGGAQDNGTSKYDGTSWGEVIGGDGGFTKVDQTNPLTVYQTFNGTSIQRSDNGGTSFTDKKGGLGGSGLFYNPFILDPANQSVVLLGTSNLYRSTTRGDSWTSIASNGVGGYGSAASITAIGAYDTTIYAANKGGSIYATSTTGLSWASVAPQSGTWNDIYVNPNYPKDVYVVNGSFTGASAGHVFRSVNGGTNWTDISGTLKDQPYNAIKLDQKSGTLYVGGDDGVYYSKDFGMTWLRLGTALPNAQVVDLVISPVNGILAAGTHGRGMWTIPLDTTVATPTVSSAPALTRNASSQIVVNLTLRNSGKADYTNVTVNSVTVSGQACTPVAYNVGTVPASAARTDAGTYTSTVTAATGTQVPVRVKGSSAQGNFSYSYWMTAP